jgi:hypothetical protein
MLFKFLNYMIIDESPDKNGTENRELCPFCDGYADLNTSESSGCDHPNLKCCEDP